MTQPPHTVVNTASPHSVVGIQAEVVHDSTIYVVSPNDPPDRKYQAGVSFLNNGVPRRARELISEAISHGYESSEVRFHWLLAMLSKRTHRELSVEEQEQLRCVRDTIDRYPKDEWKHGIQVICDLLEAVGDPQRDPGATLKKLHALDSNQRAQILRHLDLFLVGPIKANLWAETRDAAEKAQFENDRMERVWAYFYPDPIGPRVRKPEPVSTTFADQATAVVAAGVFVVAMSALGWLTVVHGQLISIVAYLLVLAAGSTAIRAGLEWRHRVERLRVKEYEHADRWHTRQPPAGGFASRVDERFEYYFAKYLPRGVDSQFWLTQTSGIRKTLRDEVVELYREERVRIERVSWLIRHLVSDVRKRWENGTLWNYRKQYHTPLATKAVCCLSLTVLILGSAVVFQTATSVKALIGTLATLVAIAAGWAATTKWSRIALERRRLAEEIHEHDRQWRDRLAAYNSWKRRLQATKPSEAEMEAWLQCDRTLLLDEALRHYKLGWRDIIAHAFLQSPATGSRYKRARTRNGPWRYSKYDIRLFLITADGVREFSTELDFEGAKFCGERRTNFRFDAVASVNVTKSSTSRQTLELTLVNGPTMTIRIVDEHPKKLQPGEDPETLFDVTLDAAGFGHALHILEGIAAEGKQWVTYDPYSRNRLAGTMSAVRELLD